MKDVKIVSDKSKHSTKTNVKIVAKTAAKHVADDSKVIVDFDEQQHALNAPDAPEYVEPVRQPQRPAPEPEVQRPVETPPPRVYKPEPVATTEDHGFPMWGWWLLGAAAIGGIVALVSNDDDDDETTAATTTVTTPTIALTTDTGTSATDTITNNSGLTTSTVASGVTRTYSVDGGTASSTYTAPTTDGKHTVTIVDKDASGNTATATTTFTLDKTIATPTVALTTDSGTSATDKITNNAGLTFSAAAADVTRTYKVDGGTASTTYTAPTTDGSHTVIVTDVDTAGNSSTATTTFTLDKTIATPTVALATDSGSSSTDTITNVADLKTSAIAADVTRTYTVDGGTASSTYTKPTTDGKHTVVVNDVDTAGNTASATTSFTLDTTKPAAGALNVSGATAASVTDADGKFDLGLTGNEANSIITYQQSTDNSVWSDLTAASQAGVAAGTHYYRAQVADVAGNIDYSNVISVVI